MTVPSVAPSPGSSTPDALSPYTRMVAAGRGDGSPSSPVNPPITMTSTYRGQGTFSPGDHVYARSSNPSWEPFEEVLAGLEGADVPAVLFSSGMAAISAAVQVCAPEGSRLVVPQVAYNTSVALFDDLESRGRYRVDRIDFTDTDTVVAALGEDGDRPAASLIWLESPSNPMLEVLDLPRILEAARAAGTTSVADNTFATPLGARPLSRGADVVVHSVTKFLAGHSDVVLGAVVPSTAALREELVGHRTMHGAIAGPFEAWLALRGVRTLGVRFDRAQANAAELARRLHDLPTGVGVRYPGLPDDPHHALAVRDLDGFGAIVTLDLGDAAVADRVVEATRLWVPATSLGGVESLLERRRRHAVEPAVVPEGLIRLSVGIEDVEDLWSDLSRAIEVARGEV